MLPHVPAGTLIHAPTILSSLALPWHEIPNVLEAQVFLPPLTISAQRSLEAADATGEILIKAVAKTEVANAAPIVFVDFSVVLTFFIVF
jgi:hypothetical protein